MACCRWATVLPTSHLLFSLILNPLNQLEHLAPTHVMTCKFLSLHAWYPTIRHFPSWHPFPNGTAVCNTTVKERRVTSERGEFDRAPFRPQGGEWQFGTVFPALLEREKGRKNHSILNANQFPWSVWLAPLLNCKFGSRQPLLWMQKVLHILVVHLSQFVVPLTGIMGMYDFKLQQNVLNHTIEGI